MDLSPKKLSNSSIQCPESGCNMRKRQINDLIAHVAIDHNYIEDFLPKHWHVIKETKEESTDKNTRMESNSATNRNEADDKMCNETDESASIEDERNIESRSIEEEDHSLSKRPVSSETSRLVAGINNSTKNIEQEPKRRHQSLVSDDAKTASQEKNSASSKKSKWQCHFCPAPKFKNKNSLHYHYAGVHFKDQISALIGQTNICPECNRSFNKHNDLVRHVGAVHKYLERYNIEGCTAHNISNKFMDIVLIYQRLSSLILDSYHLFSLKILRRKLKRIHHKQSNQRLLRGNKIQPKMMTAGRRAAMNGILQDQQLNELNWSENISI